MRLPIINRPVSAMRVIPSPWPEASGGGFYIEATNDITVEVLPPWFETAEAAEDFLLDCAAREARDEFRKVRAALPADPFAHPMSGRVGEY